MFVVAFHKMCQHFKSAHGNDVHEREHTHTYVGRDMGLGEHVDLNVDVDVEVLSTFGVMRDCDII